MISSLDIHILIHHFITSICSKELDEKSIIKMSNPIQLLTDIVY